MMNRACVLLFILGMIVIQSVNANAANHYVRPNGGSYGLEDGSDWTNAYNGFSDISWATIAAGDTIWVAGGTYTQALSFTKGGTDNATRITVKRATTSAHGTETGWNAGFDAQVLINGYTISTGGYNNITIDGQVANGIKIVHTGGYGLNSTNSGNNDGSDNFTARYITIVGGGPSSDCNHQGWHAVGGTNVLIEYCDMSSYPGGIIRADVKNLTFQYNTIHEANNGGSACHNDLLISYNGNGTIRNNNLYNTLAAGLAFADNSGPWYIYNNLIYQKGSYIGNGNLIECQRNAIIYVYNNVIAFGSHGLDTSTRSGLPNSTGNAYNNIFYNVTTPILNGPVYIHDYNWFSGSNKYYETNGVVGGTEDPYISSSKQDFRLVAGSSAIKKGKYDIGPPYNIDIVGTIRPEGIAWSLGAYEFQEKTPLSPQIIGIDP